MSNDSIQNAPSIGKLNADNRAGQVLLFNAGPLRFGIAEEYVATIVEWHPPTPLPHSPAAVLGVVSIQGRMLTVLDLARLSAGVGSPANESYRQIIALRGDEQLALAASGGVEPLELPPDTSPNETPDRERYVESSFTHAGTDIGILNVSELFAAAVQGRERRRRRF